MHAALAPPDHFSKVLRVPVAVSAGEARSASYVGFTASTGRLASEAHDIRSFRLCHRLGCSAD